MLKKLQNFLNNNRRLNLENEKHLAFILCKFLKYGWGENGDPDELCSIATERWSGNMAKLINNNTTRRDKMERLLLQYQVMKEALNYTFNRKKIFSLEQIVDLIHPYTSKDDLPFSAPTSAAGEGKIGILTGVIHITPEGRLNFSYRKQASKYDPPFRNFELHKYYTGTFKPLFDGVNWNEKGENLTDFDPRLKTSENLDIFKIFQIANIDKISTFFTTEKQKRKVYFSTELNKIYSDMRDPNFKDYEIQESEDAIGLI